jgi:hypothetical protein
MVHEMGGRVYRKHEPLAKFETDSGERIDVKIGKQEEQEWNENGLYSR